jgi:hypothetical protein
VIVLAGHGAQIPAPEAGAAAGHVEVDGLDEVFLPADVKSWEDGWIENAILDDEIGRWLNQFRRKGVHVWVVFDCCHASGLARRKILRPNNDDTDHRGIHFDDLKVPIHAPGPARKPLPIGHAVIEHPGWLDRGWDSGDGSGSVVAFYACQGSELTPELPRPKDAARVPENYYGLFSYTLISALTRSSRPLSYRELRQTIEARYAQDRPGLPPRIAVEGAVDRVALGFSSWPSPPTLALSETEARSWSVDGGELTGLLESSILALHRPKVDPASPKSILGYLQIKELGPIRAIVEPTSYRGCLPVDPNILTTGMTCEIVAD